MNKYTWTIKPDLKDVDLINMYDQSCYSDDCLTSTYFRDEILDFIEDDHNIKVTSVQI